MKIALVNDYKTRIANTKTFWHYLEDTLDAKFFSTKKLFWKYHLNKYRPDIVIQNAMWGNLNINYPVVMLIQDNYHALMNNGSLSKEVCEQKINKFKEAIDVSCYVVVNVKSQLEYYKLNPHKSCHIPMGVNEIQFFNSPKERKAIRKQYNVSGKCFIYVGDETDIHGWGDVKQKILNGPEKWFVVSKNNRIDPLRDGVKSFCNINHNELRALYNASDIFYARGSIGLPALEAMLCGVKVDVSHDIGYFENWWPDNIDPRKEVLRMGFGLHNTVIRWKNLLNILVNGFSV